jgi:hypothetical protein
MGSCRKMDRERASGYKKESVFGVLPDAVIVGAFVAAEIHIGDGSRCWIDEKGGLVQAAAGCIEIVEIFVGESEGLANAWALGDAGKEGTFFGFARPIFAEAGASV